MFWKNGKYSEYTIGDWLNKLNYLYFKKYLFIYCLFLFILAVPGLSCSMQVLLVAACGLLSCSMHVGSSSPTRDQTLAPCIGSMESYPLDHQGSP